MNDERLKEILSFDPLSQAERISGNNYKEDESTMMMGFMMDMIHEENKEATLKSLDDTTFNNDLNNYIRIIESEGFQKIFEVEFYNELSKKNEKMFVYFQKGNGILLNFNTFWGQKSVNGGKFYYNWKPNSIDVAWGITSGGSYQKDNNNELVWIGNHDCREALRFHIRQLKNNGQFITPWIKIPFYWLIHHGDNRDDQYPFDSCKQITKERIDMFPEWVKKMIIAEEF